MTGSELPFYESPDARFLFQISFIFIDSFGNLIKMNLNIDRLSHSFPPGYENNNTYLAKVHTLFKSIENDFDPKKVKFRAVKDENEIEEIKLLHKEWFPPQYPDEFYQQLLENKKCKSLLCVYETKIKGMRHTLILGCMTFEYRYLANDVIHYGPLDYFSDKIGIYILTFGVINEVRNKGMGTLLLKTLIKLSEEEQIIKCFYLHVVSYNDQGIKCYEKNGFLKVGLLTDHYEIFGKEYDALVYCYYTNGGSPPLSYKEIVSKCIYAVNVPYHLYRLGRFSFNYISKSFNKGSKYKELKV